VVIFNSSVFSDSQSIEVELFAAAVHLLSASFMSAPCSLALSKLVYPETEVTKTGFAQMTLEKGYTEAS
jgi:nucleoside permease NupC